MALDGRMTRPLVERLTNDALLAGRRQLRELRHQTECGGRIPLPPESFVYFELVAGGHTTLACRALSSHRPSRFIQTLVNRR